MKTECLKGNTRRGCQFVVFSSHTQFPYIATTLYIKILLIYISGTIQKFSQRGSVPTIRWCPTSEYIIIWIATLIKLLNLRYIMLYRDIVAKENAGRILSSAIICGLEVCFGHIIIHLSNSVYWWQKQYINFWGFSERYNCAWANRHFSGIKPNKARGLLSYALNWHRL
jgi:hypothetical protein